MIPQLEWEKPPDRFLAPVNRGLQDCQSLSVTPHLRMDDRRPHGSWWESLRNN